MEYPEQPELELVRASYDCTMSMKDRMPWNEPNKTGIVAMAVPKDMHNQMKKKFELYDIYDRCFKAVKSFLLSKIKRTKKKQLSIDIPISLHPMLQKRESEEWDFDSRLEVFENMRGYIESKFDDPDFLKEMSNKFGQEVNYTILLDADEEEGYCVWIEVYFVDKAKKME